MSPKKPKKSGLIKHWQTLTFVISKLVPSSKMFKKSICVNRDIYGKNTSAETLQDALVNNLPVSHSGRNIAELLSFPNNLYTIDSVTPGIGKEGCIVSYSRPQAETGLLSELEAARRLCERRQTTLKITEAKVEKSESEMRSLFDWQMTDLVFHSCGDFIWNLMPGYQRTELANCNIFGFADMYYIRHSRQITPARNAARRIYDTIDEDLRLQVERVATAKAVLSGDRHRLAHPYISEAQLNQYLDKLGASSQDLVALEVDLFEHLKRTSMDLQERLWG